AITDSLVGGLTFVTGGGYTRSDAAVGVWNLLRHSVLIGNTQPIADGSLVPDNPAASNGGPVNPSGVSCDDTNDAYCLLKTSGVSFARSGFGLGQRLFNIYDGPSYQDSNAYLSVHPLRLGGVDACKGQTGNPSGLCIDSFKWMQGRIVGMPLE